MIKSGHGSPGRAAFLLRQAFGSGIMLGFYNYTLILTYPGILCPAALPLTAAAFLTPFRPKKPALGKKDALSCEEVVVK